MLLDASSIRAWDRCRRLGVWRQQWTPNRMTPLSMVYAALHRVMTCTDYSGPGMAKDYVMELAAQRGVHTDRDDPYAMCVHYSHLAEVLARVLRQPTSAALVKHLPVQVGGVVWQPEGYLTEGNTRIMRLVLVDHWDDDRQLAELHDWACIGDVCMTQLPMTLRVLVIGQSRAGHRYGHFTRARQHPKNKTLRFARKHGRDDGLAGSWLNVWREDSTIGPDAWIAQMARDEVLREVAFERRVLVPGQVARDKVKDDIRRIGNEMSVALDPDIGPVQFPMTRSACDSVMHGPCRFQCCCYSELDLDPGETGLFNRK